MDWSSRQKLNRKIRELTNVIMQMGLIDMCRTYPQDTKEYNFSKPLETFLKLTTNTVTKQISTDVKIVITPCIFWFTTSYVRVYQQRKL